MKQQSIYGFLSGLVSNLLFFLNVLSWDYSSPTVMVSNFSSRVNYEMYTEACKSSEMCYVNFKISCDSEILA